jgi:hypothetical protein
MTARQRLKPLAKLRLLKQAKTQKLLLDAKLAHQSNMY